jgi:L-arabinokinase
MNDDLFVEGSAHGRLDVMGGIADYSGSLVLQMPIQDKTIVRLKLRSDYISTFTSTTESGEVLNANANLIDFSLDGTINYTFAQARLKELKESSWIAYVLGCALVLQKEKQLDFKGADFIIQSSIPLGKGVSSSASIEIATMKALQQAFDLKFSGTELPRLAQRVENLIVGAPCGLMDQLSCYFAKPKTLLPILCQPDKLQEAITIPEDLHFIGIDSGVRHFVGASYYTDVRCAAFMGYTIIAQLAGATANEIKNAIHLNDFSALPYSGYLCNISVDEFDKQFKEELPIRLSGKEFVARYGESIDQLTKIDLLKQYHVKVCTEHPVYENDRVRKFKKIMEDYTSLGNPEQKINAEKLGKLMYQSHESYSVCGLGSERTDEIINLSKKYPGIAGAKITGGGSGGTVCLLASGDSGQRQVVDLQQTLNSKYKEQLRLFA